MRRKSSVLAAAIAAIITAPITRVAASAQCFTLSSSSVCGTAFAGYGVTVDSQYFTDEPSLDTYFETQFQSCKYFVCDYLVDLEYVRVFW